uniref:DUF724 domain-containing protein 6-like isoform X2 n=1 Tax=Erigeron canadensis TaxID=72917 RepID=UPI001CB8F78C|nr:DUF724 domain-containing protein 6-like isoform X2 [Erigeron canadensis]
MGPTRTQARLIIRIGTKVEVSFEEHVFRGVWFPATIVEDLGNNLFVVEYRCIGINDQAEIRKVTVDHLHIRPFAPQFRSTNFGLLEKVDAFYDFGWWSGVITKKLADNRYVVYFKHTNKVKELSHLELRPHVEWKEDKWLTPYQVPVFDDFDNADDDVANGDSGTVNCSTEVTETISLNLANLIEDAILVVDKQTFIETTSMKRAKTTSLGSNTKSSKSSKKIKAVGTSDDPSLANVGQSKEVDKSPVDKTVVKTVSKSKIVTRGNKKPIERGKSVKLEQPKVISARKKGKLSADNTEPEAIPKGANITPDIVEGDRASRIWPIPVIMGLQCIAMSASNKPKTTRSFAPLSPKTTGTSGRDQQFVPLSPKRTGNMDNDEGDGTVPKRKRGRPFKTEANNQKTSLAENHSNGKIIPDEATVMGYVSRKKRSPPSTVEVNFEKVPNRISGIELSLQQENSKTVKGKRGKPGTLGSVDMESPPQDSQEPSTQISNKIIETSVEKSLDSVLDDQPLAKWFVGKHSSAAPDSTGKKSSESSKDPPAMANGDAPKLTFEKRSQLWGTIEAMEVFHLFPQNPHFRPLDNYKETARERQAINLMVNFSGVFEDMSRLRFDHPRTEIGDHLDTLNELESHGFDVHRIRKRLNELLSLKDEHEKLATNSNEFKGKIETGSVEVKIRDQEIELINTQVKKLKEKRDQITKSMEEKDSELESLKVELEEIKKGMALARCTFEGLAATSL